jgi:hypothetical protein
MQQRSLGTFQDVNTFEEVHRGKVSDGFPLMGWRGPSTQEEDGLWKGQRP